MAKKLLYILGGVIILAAVFALGWMLATRFGLRAEIASVWGPGMMGNGFHMGAMPHDFGRGLMRGDWNMMRGGFGGAGLFGFGFRILGWLVQVALIAAVVTWFVKRQAPAVTAPPATSVPAATPSAPTSTNES